MRTHACACRAAAASIRCVGWRMCAKQGCCFLLLRQPKRPRRPQLWWLCGTRNECMREGRHISPSAIMSHGKHLPPSSTEHPATAILHFPCVFPCRTMATCGRTVTDKGCITCSKGGIHALYVAAPKLCHCCAITDFP